MVWQILDQAHAKLVGEKIVEALEIREQLDDAMNRAFMIGSFISKSQVRLRSSLTR